ncbi:MAG: 16S rRNA pseudouridine(516) synthase, partial [Candidatus Limiplasma sp.]|nr:16S rRNA pseudouridine(516) synthase [Candidatus Limiplasma sp.]
GMVLSDFTAKPAQMRIWHACEAESLAQVDLREGKYHQVKRMFAACGHPVLTLHRSVFGPVRLPEDAQPGYFRELTAGEVASLKQAVTSSNKEEQHA